MCTLCDLRFVLCSRDLDELTCAKDHRLFYLNYPQSKEVENSDHVVAGSGSLWDGEL